MRISENIYEYEEYKRGRWDRRRYTRNSLVNFINLACEDLGAAAPFQQPELDLEGRLKILGD